MTTSGSNPLVLLSVASAPLLKRYQSSLEAANLSPKTITWYQGILVRYFAFLNSTGPSQPVNKLVQCLVNSLTTDV